MRGPDPKTTLSELREYFASSHESERKIAACIGVSQTTICAWFAGKQRPSAESVARLRAFFDAEDKRLAQGDGIRPVESVPYKIIRPLQQVRYALSQAIWPSQFAGLNSGFNCSDRLMRHIECVPLECSRICEPCTVL